MLEGCSDILDCENILVSRLKNVDLLGEITLSPEDVGLLGAFISKSISIDISDGTDFLKSNAPTSLACFLGWRGILDYEDGDFWSSIEKNTGLSGPNWKSKWGEIFVDFLKTHEFPIFEIKDAHKYVSNILIQGTIPNSCLDEYYDKVLLPLINKELISSDPKEISFLLQNWRDNEFKRLEKEELLKDLNGTKEDCLRKIKSIEPIVEVWEEIETIQVLKSEIESMDKPDIKEMLASKRKMELEILEINKNIEDFKAMKDRYVQDLSKLSEEDSFILEHSEAIEDGCKVSSELIAGENEVSLLQREIESIEIDINKITDDLFGELWDQQYIEIIRNIPYSNLEEKVKEYQSLKKRELEEKNVSKNFIKSIFCKLSFILPFLKKKNENPSKLTYDEIQTLLNGLPLADKPQEELFLSLVPRLKKVSELYDDYFIAKENVNKVEKVNKELLTKLSSIVDLVGIDFDVDFKEVYTKLADFSNKLIPAKEHKKLAEIASVEIENIDTKIENALSSQIHLKTQLYELNRDIVGIQENPELKKLEYELNLKIQNLLKSNPDLNEVKIKIENLKRKGLDKNCCLEGIRSLNGKKKEIEDQINNLEPTLSPYFKFFAYVDKPVQRYFLYCEKHADKFIFQSIKMLKQSMEKGTLCDPAEIDLPKRVINSFGKWWDNYHQKSLTDSNNGISNGFQGYKFPIIYFDYSGEIRAKFPSQILKLEDCTQELYLSLIPDENKPYNTPLSLYRLDEGLFESEAMDFEIEIPAENYKFQLIYGRETIKTWVIPSGIKPDRSIMVFDSESKQLIQNVEIPRAQILIVSESEYTIKPDECLLEEGELYGKWSGYAYRGVDLSNVDTLVLSSSTGNECIMQVEEKSPLSVVLTNGRLLQGVYSGDNEVYAGMSPSIRVNFEDERDIDNWILSIYKKNEQDYSYYQQHCLCDLKEILKIDHQNNLFEIPLEAEMCLGKEAFGGFIVRLKNDIYNYDKKFTFCIFPHINFQFNNSIYLPGNSGHEDIHLIVQLPESSSFEVRYPAEVVFQRGTSLDIIIDTSQKTVDGVLKNTISREQVALPVSIHIPRVTWGLKGLKDDIYNGEFDESLEIPDETFLDVSGENLLLKVSFPSLIEGTCTLKHQDSGQTTHSKIKDNFAIFDILRFIDTVKATSNSSQMFNISVQPSKNINAVIENVPLFSIRKWTIKNIECVQKKEGNKRIFQVKWDQEGSIENACLVLWELKNQLQVNPVNLKEIPIDGSKNILTFEIDESSISPGRYLLHFTRQDSWAQPIFPGENAPNSKEIYIDIVEASLLERGNREFEAGNYMKAIDIYRKVSNAQNIGNVWIQKINNGLIYNKKFGEAISAFYHLLRNDKQFSDTDCFHIPFLLKSMLNKRKLENNDLVLMLISLLHIVNKKEKYRLSSIKADALIPEVLDQIETIYPQLTDELRENIKTNNSREIVRILKMIRGF